MNESLDGYNIFEILNILLSLPIMVFFAVLIPRLLIWSSPKLFKAKITNIIKQTFRMSGKYFLGVLSIGFILALINFLFRPDFLNFLEK